MDLECAGSMEQTYSRLASVITDGVRSGKEQTMSEQPKPCPFCGWGTIVDEPFWLPNKHICKCNACGARTKICRTWEDAVKLWNMRQGTDDA